MTTVIYHSADYDGIFCREIARKFVPDVELIGWNFGDAILSIPNNPEVTTYVMDLPIDKVFGLHFENIDIVDNGLLPWSNLVWIDHHKSSIESHPGNILGYRIDGVAACRLAWQWFRTGQNKRTNRIQLPDKEEYTGRDIEEPLAVRLAGEYDVWDKRDPDADVFQYGLRCQDGDFDWNELLCMHGTPYVDDLLKGGKWAQAYAQKMDADLVKYKSYRLKWDGLDFLVLNTGRFNSLTFSALDVPETGHDALMGYMFNGKVWTVSLYHAKHRTDLDLSEIAKKYGGGGHRGACGFTCKTLPWMAHEACEKGDAA